MVDWAYTYDFDRLRRRFAEMGLTYAELCEIAKLAQPTVKRVLVGQGAKPKSVGRVAEALGLKLADLVVKADTQVRA